MVLLMAWGPSHSAILSTVTDTLCTVETWCKSHKLEISKEKMTLMPMYTRNSDSYKNHTDIKSWGLKVASKMKYLGIMIDSKMDWFPHTQYLENKLLHIRNNLARCSKATWGVSYANRVIIYKYAILPTITYAAEARYNTTSKHAKNKLQQIQRSFLIFLTKPYRTVSLEALSAIAEIMPIDLTLKLFTNKRAITQGLPTNAVIVQLKKIETPIKMRGDHPIDSYIKVELTCTEGTAEVSIFTEGSKTDHHVGAGMVAVRNCREIYIKTQRLHITCTVFQAELRGIDMAVNWIGKQRTKAPSYVINVDSKAALLAIANKQATHPLAVAIRRKTIDLKKVTSVTFHRIWGHTGKEGNERADYLARTIAS